MPNIASPFYIRDYRDEDRSILSEAGWSIIDWWHGNGPGTSLNLVAASDSGAIVGHLQATDRSLPVPSRRPGQIHFGLNVHPASRRLGIGSALYEHLELFAAQREAALIYVSYSKTRDVPAAPFLASRGFTPLEQFLPSSLELRTFDPARFRQAVHRIEAQGIRLQTYAELGDNPDHRRKLYELEQAARATQPYREVGPYIPEPFEKWERGFAAWEPETVFVAASMSQDVWAGVVTGLEWYFTGVHPDWRGRGIATALKARCLTEAKRRGIGVMETENHEDNAAMLAVNRKLGFLFGVSEVACIKRLT